MQGFVSWRAPPDPALVALEESTLFVKGKRK
jgi:hypothetical protein